MNARSSSLTTRGGARVMTLLKPATVSPFFPTMRPRSLHPEITFATLSFERGELAAQPRAHPSRAPGQVLVVHDLEVLYRQRARRRVAAEGVDVEEVIVLLRPLEGLEDLPLHRGGGERQIGARNALRHRHDVRPDAVVLV